MCQRCRHGDSGTSDSNVPGDALAQALHALPRLQRLHIGGGASCRVTESTRVMGALPVLSSLTHLGLSCGGAEWVAVGEVLPELRALKDLGAALFRGGSEAEAQAAADAFAARFPKGQISTSRCAAGQ